MYLRPVVTLLFLVIVPASLHGSSGAKTNLDWRREVAAARQRHDYEAMLTAAQAAADIRRDSPRDLLNLAGAYALTGHRDLALSTLDELVGRCVYLPLAESPDLANLRDLAEFDEILIAMERNRQRQGFAEAILTMRDIRGIIEGIAYRPATGDFFFADVHDRCVWRVPPDGKRLRFTSLDSDLLGVFELAVDEAHGLLWISTSAIPQMSRYSAELKGHGELAALNLADGHIVRRYRLPGDGRDHCLGGFAIAPDGTIYVTDSAAPVIWRRAVGGDRLEPFLESPAFISLQGIGVLPGNKLVVTDHAVGIALVDLASREISWMRPSLRTTLLGLDSLIVQGNYILAVQNGIAPQRVVRIRIPTGLNQPVRLDVLAAAAPDLDDLTHFVFRQGKIAVVSGSGWANPGENSNPSVHTVRVMMVDVPR